MGTLVLPIRYALFSQAVAETSVRPEDGILLIYRSGERSKAAGQVLLEAEVDNVF